MPQRSAKNPILVAGPTGAFDAGLKKSLMLEQLKATAKPSFFDHSNLNKVIHRVNTFIIFSYIFFKYSIILFKFLSLHLSC